MRRVILSAAMSVAIHAMMLLPFAPLGTSASVKPENRAILVSLRAVHKTSQSPENSAAAKQPEKPIPVKPPIRPAPLKEPPARQTPKIEKPVQKKEEPARRPEIGETPVEPEGGAEAAVMSLAAPANNDTPSGTSPSAGGGAYSDTGRASAVVDVSSLTVTKKIQPVYPMISRKRSEQGTVTLLVTIATGAVESVRVEISSGHAPLDEAALKAAKGWKFQIAGTDAVVARIPFVFTLK